MLHHYFLQVCFNMLFIILELLEGLKQRSSTFNSLLWWPNADESFTAFMIACTCILPAFLPDCNIATFVRPHEPLLASLSPVNPRVESPGKNTVLLVLVCSWNQTKSFNCYFRILMRNGFLTKLGKRQDSYYLTPPKIS